MPLVHNFTRPTATADIGESRATLLSEIPASDRTNSPHLRALHLTNCAFGEWTTTHGFFAWMGGFMLYFDDKLRVTLTPNELKCFVREGSVEMPIIMEADIED
ncbi:uncharacterized protein F5891DRAFT_1194679 [Suillus fuscotomentosus]|uniref:Uncharacterized protein n=1 Tax=Suillus fuscotomentosus TaxID=1912939 RepID=A0AAD4HG68_9AGAM|nr:uncharacterized protein F5891DRAFT_1194679 [Suillus fuscotomentosus]KAG1895016.1 hypothetical protein F5891DRAFT_1194679 [Suillus fuscotomentosus]